MARLHLIYDTQDLLAVPGPDACEGMAIKCALMPLPDDPSAADVRRLAEDLAEMLMVQMGYGNPFPVVPNG